MLPRRVQFYDTHPTTAQLSVEVFRGLARRPRSLPPKLFYDERGSALFDAICEAPEYYLTRTETAILHQRLEEIATLAGEGCILIELGSGSSRKARPLIERLQPRAYVPLDISREHLLAASTEVASQFPWLTVCATCMDYTAALDLPFDLPPCRRIAFFPGSTIGNFEPPDAAGFLHNIARTLGPGGALIIGVDTKKSADLLHAAYNDAGGVTAAFNRNIMERINRELDATFDAEKFEHDAFYNDEKGRVEMHLVSTEHQVVRIDNIRFVFERGERLHTESSYKYDDEEFASLARTAGFTSQHVWTDPDHKFAVHCLTVPAAHRE